MSELLTEQDVLDKLGIENFRFLRKEHAMALASALPDMAPDVAVKVVEQFPEYANAMQSLFSEYKEVILSIEHSVEKNETAVFAQLDRHMGVLENLIDKCEDNTELRIECLKQMQEIDNMCERLNDKKHIHAETVVKYISTALTIAGFLLAGTLGVKSISTTNDQPPKST